MATTLFNIKNRDILPQLYFWGLILMAASLPLSRYMMSVSQFFLSGILILEFIPARRPRELLRKYPGNTGILLLAPAGLLWVAESMVAITRRFFRKENLPAIVFFSLYLLHVLGLLFTVDFDYALKDLRVKLPLLVMPVIFTVTESLDRKKFNIIMLFFSASVIVGTFISTYILFTQDVDNVRDISVFISHIRFGLLISVAIFTLAYFAAKKNDFPQWARGLFMCFALWLVLYLLLSASITGLVVLLVSLFVVAIHYTLKKKNIYSRIATVTLLLTPVVIFLYIMGVVADVYKVHRVDFSTLEKRTPLGGIYWHDTTNLQTENGYYVWIYIATDEMRKTWNERSEFDFDGKDKKGQDLKFTLIRYLTSKGLRKDGMGVRALAPSDIALVEDGEASAHYHERGVFYVRLYKTTWEIQQYLLTGNPSGHSAMQRIEYWKTSWMIIRQHLLTGVGTGDMNIAFARQYEMMDSPLQPEFRWRSHNQFLSIAVGFGLIGFIWFWIVLLYPPLKTRRMTDYFYLVFFVIMMVSMISEDTIETQAGVTIFAFFTSLFLFGKKDVNHI